MREHAPMRTMLPESRLVRGVGVVALLTALVGLLVFGYGALQASSAFPVDRIVVDGGGDGVSRAVRERARTALGPAGLLQVDATGVERAVEQLPTVRRATVDRSFPDTLVIRVVPERPVARVSVDDAEVLLGASGRIIGPVGAAGSGLPQVSAARSDIPGIGGTVQSRAVRDQLRLASASTRGLGIVGIGYDDTGLTASTRRGHQVRFGTADDLEVKIAAASAVLRAGDGPVRYVDVAVPEAPVVRGEEDDERTAYAPPPSTESLRPVAEIGTWITDVSPGESIRTIFG